MKKLLIIIIMPLILFAQNNNKFGVSFGATISDLGGEESNELYNLMEYIYGGERALYTGLTVGINNTFNLHNRSNIEVELLLTQRGLRVSDKSNSFVQENYNYGEIILIWKVFPFTKYGGTASAIFRNDISLDFGIFGNRLINTQVVQKINGEKTTFSLSNNESGVYKLDAGLSFGATFYRNNFYCSPRMKLTSGLNFEDYLANFFILEILIGAKLF